MPHTLIITPQIEEHDVLFGAWRDAGHSVDELAIGRLDCARVLNREQGSDASITLAVGGHGKTQFGVQTQYLMDRCPDVNRVVCCGAAGSLSPDVSVGDVVVGTATVEHDYQLRFVRRPSPLHVADTASVAALRDVATSMPSACAVHFGVIASGDEDIVATSRAEHLRRTTDACCVAWEGSGGARAAAFNHVAFVEVRGVTDFADKAAAADFRENLPVAMTNVARLLGHWLL